MAFNKIHTEDPLEIRPRFKVHIADRDSEFLTNYFKEQSQSDSTLRSIKTYGTHLDIHINKEEETFWSPVLQLNLENDENGALMRCLIGPQQSHWLMFVFIYGVLSILGFFAGTYGLTRYLKFDEVTPWLFTFPLLLIIIVGIYLMVKMAQKAKHEQIVHLVRFLYKHLDGFTYKRLEE